MYVFLASCYSGFFWHVLCRFFVFDPGEQDLSEQEVVIKDANGNVLADGDAVTVIKDLKIKGSSSVVKVGTKVKSIRLLPDASDGHDIDCKVDGIGAIKLKSEYVKKV